MDHATAKTLTAIIICCKPNQLINFRLVPDGVIALSPDGRKHHISINQLEHEQVRLVALNARSTEPSRQNRQAESRNEPALHVPLPRSDRRRKTKNTRPIGLKDS